MRALGLDLGERRIGVAVSDPLGMTAQALGVLERASGREDLERVAASCSRWEVGCIVVGLPVSLSGEEGKAARRARRFARRLEARVGVPVVLWDERLSTAEAEKLMIGADVSRGARREKVDAVAAALILQGYLDRQRHAGPAPTVEQPEGG